MAVEMGSWGLLFFNKFQPPSFAGLLDYIRIIDVSSMSRFAYVRIVIQILRESSPN